MQEVLIVAWRRHESFDPSRGSYEVWTYGIVLREVLNYRKRMGRKCRGVQPIALDTVDDSALPWAHDEDRYMLRDTLLQCLATLPEEQAVMFLAHMVEGADFRSIAAAHGISPSTAHARIEDARERLKQAIE